MRPFLVPAVALAMSWLCIGAGAQTDGEASGVYSLPDVRAGERFEYVVVTEGLIEPLSYEWSKGIPDGLKTDYGVLAGHPTKPIAESSRFGVKVVDALGRSLVRQFALRVLPPLEPLRITTTSIPTFIVGEDSVCEIGARGGQSPRIWRGDAVRMPDGLRLDLSGNSCIVRGKPVAVGDIEVVVSVSDGAESSEPRTLRGRVAPPSGSALRVDMASLAGAYIGVPYSATLRAIGGRPPYSWSVEWTGAPLPWCRIETDSWSLSGLPNVAAGSGLRLRVTDSAGGVDATNELTLDVSRRPGSGTPEIDASPPTTAVVGMPFHTVVIARNFDECVRWIVDQGQQPVWLEATIDGPCLRLSGTPSKVGTWSFDVSLQLLDRNAASTDAHVLWSGEKQRIELTAVSKEVHETNPQILTQSLPVAMAGMPYSSHIAASFSPRALRFRAIEELPAGLELSADGLLTGTAPALGSYDLNVEVTNEHGQSISDTIKLPVTIEPQPLRVHAAVHWSATVGDRVEWHLPLRGGVLPYTVKIDGTLPQGLLWKSDSLSLVGTLAAAGTTSLRLEITDATGSQRVFSTQQIGVSKLPDRIWPPIFLAAGGVLLVVFLFWFYFKKSTSHSEVPTEVTGPRPRTPRRKER